MNNQLDYVISFIIKAASFIVAPSTPNNFTFVANFFDSVIYNLPDKSFLEMN